MKGALACLVLVAGAIAAGCAVNTPRETFYTLDAVGVAAAGPSGAAPARAAPVGAAPASGAAGGSKFAVFVEPARVPELVDRPQMIVSISDSQVVPLEQQRWAEPLRAQIARVVALDLARVLPSARVSANEYVLDGVESSKGYRVTLDVQRFETRPGEAAAIEVAWTVRRGGDGTGAESGPGGTSAAGGAGATGAAGAAVAAGAETGVVASGRERVREAATEPGYDGAVRAHNRALASVGRTIAAALRAAAGAGN